VAILLRGAASLSARCLGGLQGLLASDEPQRERRLALEFDEDRPIEAAARRSPRIAVRGAMRSSGSASASRRAKLFRGARTTTSPPASITAAMRSGCRSARSPMRISLVATGRRSSCSPPFSSVSSNEPNRSSGKSKAPWMRHTWLCLRADRPAFGATLASTMPMSRPSAGGGVFSSNTRATRRSSQAPHRRNR